MIAEQLSDQPLNCYSMRDMPVAFPVHQAPMLGVELGLVSITKLANAIPPTEKGKNQKPFHYKKLNPKRLKNRPLMYLKRINIIV